VVFTVVVVVGFTVVVVVGFTVVVVVVAAELTPPTNDTLAPITMNDSTAFRMSCMRAPLRQSISGERSTLCSSR
jgi:hypothetical protein